MYSLTTYFRLVLAFFVVQIAAHAVDIPQANALRVRQTPPQTVVSCPEYAVLSNLTAIGTNSTFRAAFLQASPDGTAKSSAILNEAIAKWTSLALINDTVLNNACGNLSNVSLEEAPKNFSMGQVGPFKISAGVRLESGMAVVITATMVGVAMALL